VTGPQETFPLLLCGAPGTGKSSVAWEIYARLVRGGIAAATLDLDVVGYGPAPNNGSEAMKLTNLAAVAANYRAAGARCLVVSGVSATSEAVARCLSLASVKGPGSCHDLGTTSVGS
jgi:adenylylsulfate kinase-like enzyme